MGRHDVSDLPSCLPLPATRGKPAHRQLPQKLLRCRLGLTRLRCRRTSGNLPDDARAAVKEKFAEAKLDGKALLAIDSIELGTLLADSAASKVPGVVGVVLKYRDSFGAANNAEANNAEAKSMDGGPMVAVRTIVRLCGGWPQFGAGALATCTALYLAQLFAARQVFI